MTTASRVMARGFWRTLAAGVVGVVLAAGVVVAVGAASVGPTAGDEAPAPPATPNASQLAPARPVQAARPPVPLAVRIPALGVDRPLLSLAVGADGALVPPVSAADVGWFAAGTVPGEIGPAIIAAHVDSRAGPGAFFHLRDLAPGDEVQVVRSDGVVNFQVVSTEIVDKTEFPTGPVSGPTPVPELSLITCGGAFDRAHRRYLANVIVRAERVDDPFKPSP